MNTHRRILLGEMPSTFRFGSSERAYFVRILGITVRWLPLVLAIILVASALSLLSKYVLFGEAGWLTTLIIFPLLTAAWLVVLPFSLGLPAAAADRREVTLSAAYGLGSGHRRAITLIFLGCEAPLIVVSMVGSAILGPGGAIAGLWSGAMVVVTTILNAAWLSLVFKALADGDPALARQA